MSHDFVWTQSVSKTFSYNFCFSPFLSTQSTRWGMSGRGEEGGGGGVSRGPVLELDQLEQLVPNVTLMLVQRRRRWTDIKVTLDKCPCEIFGLVSKSCNASLYPNSDLYSLLCHMTKEGTISYSHRTLLVMKKSECLTLHSCTGVLWLWNELG